MRYWDGPNIGDVIDWFIFKFLLQISVSILQIFSEYFTSVRTLCFIVCAYTCTCKTWLAFTSMNTSVRAFYWSILMAVATHPQYIGGFTKYGQPIPRSDRPDRSELSTFSYGMYGATASPVCSNSTLFLRIDIYFLIRWSNQPYQSETHMHHWCGSPLSQVMAWCLLSAKP